MAKNSYKDLTAFFTSPKYADHKNMKEKISLGGFLRAALLRAKKKLPDGLDWPCYLGCSSKSHRGISFSFIFL